METMEPIEHPIETAKGYTVDEFFDLTRSLASAQVELSKEVVNKECLSAAQDLIDEAEKFLKKISDGNKVPIENNLRILKNLLALKQR
jgi:hypothetical protein